MKQYIYALIKDKENVLLLKRPKDKKVYAGYWNFPGGKMEDGEIEILCLIREVEEETGLKFKPFVKILDIVDEENETKRVAVFLGSADGIIALSSEHEEYGWFSVEQILNLPVLPYIKRIFEEAHSYVADTKS